MRRGLAAVVLGFVGVLCCMDAVYAQDPDPPFAKENSSGYCGSGQTWHASIADAVACVNADANPSPGCTVNLGTPGSWSNWSTGVERRTTPATWIGCSGGHNYTEERCEAGYFNDGGTPGAINCQVGDPPDPPDPDPEPTPDSLETIDDVHEQTLVHMVTAWWALFIVALAVGYRVGGY